MSTAEFLVNIDGLARALAMSPQNARKFLQRHPELMARARVGLGARCTRYRLDEVRAFINAMPSTPIAEPPQLARGKAAARAAATEA